MVNSFATEFLRIVSELFILTNSDNLLKKVISELNELFPEYEIVYDQTGLLNSNSLELINKGKNFGFLIFNSPVSTLKPELADTFRLFSGIVAELLQKLEDHSTSQREVNNLSELAAEKIVSFWESERVLKEVAANYPHSYVAIIERSLMASFISGQEVSRRNLNENNNLGISLEEILVEFAPLVRDKFLNTFKGEETTFAVFYKQNYFLFKTVPLINDYNEINRILTVVENITERRITEEKNRENEFFLKESQRIAKVGHYIFHLKTGFWECSEVILPILGIDETYTKDFKGLISLIAPEDVEDLKRYIQEDILVKKINFNKEFRIINQTNSEIRWLHVLGELSFDYEKNPVKMIGTAQDITERKEREALDLLREAKIKMHHHSFLELTNNPEIYSLELKSSIKTTLQIAATSLDVERASYWTVDFEKDGFICEWLFEKSKNEFSGNINLRISSFPEYFKAITSSRSINASDVLTDSRTAEFVEAYLKPLNIASMLDLAVRVNGKIRAVLCFEHVGIKRSWKAEETTFAGDFADFLSLLLVMEEKNNFQKILAESLKEKELLLKELYHRTKNNMQVISSMINLRLNEITDKRAIQIFEDTKNKIQSMAMVHQKLYQSKNLSNINLKEYVLDLIKLLRLSFRIQEERVIFNVKAEELEVSIDVAVPCGLILNEIITNALKHAFPDDRKGKIDIEIFRKEQNNIAITFQDNGIGLPEGFDITKVKSMGLQTVVGITVHQLGGKVLFENRNGTFVDFTFKDNFYTIRI